MRSTFAFCASPFNKIKGVGVYPGQAEIVDFAKVKPSSFKTLN